MKQTRPFRLASASPRRRELFERFGFAFEVTATDLDEAALPGESPEDQVTRLALAKAEAAAPVEPGVVVIGGDTLVTIDGEVLGKPGNPDSGRRMLRRLSGKTHRVLSGYCLLETGGSVVNRYEETKVTFRELPESWIDWYAEQDEMLDKAGGYGIQGHGGLMVSRIEGSYTNVVGMPVEAMIWDMIRMGWVVL